MTTQYIIAASPDDAVENINCYKCMSISAAKMIKKIYSYGPEFRIYRLDIAVVDVTELSET